MTKFKPGQSGNIHGRPKGSKNLKKIVDDLLNEEIVVKGSTTKISAKKAMIKVQAAKALKGDDKALMWLLSHVSKDELMEVNYIYTNIDPSYFS